MKKESLSSVKHSLRFSVSMHCSGVTDFRANWIGGVRPNVTAVVGV